MRASLFLFSALLLSSLPAQADSKFTTGLNVMSAGQSLSFDETRQLSIKFWLQQLMLSAVYRDVVQHSSLAEWHERLSFRTRIHCVYDVTATLAIPERRMLTFDEVLVPLTGGYPEFIFIKRGEQVLRLAKYDPWVFQRLVSETGISAAPALSVVERGLF